MRVLTFTSIVFFLFGCSGDYCSELDLKAFERPEALHQCYPDQYTEEKMEEEKIGQAQQKWAQQKCFSLCCSVVPVLFTSTAAQAA